MNEVEMALFTKFTGATAITSLLASASSVYNPMAPEGAPYPLMIFSQMSGTGDNDNPHDAVQLLYQAKGVSVVGRRQAGEINAAIRATLHRVTLIVPGWTNFLTRWESSIPGPGVEDIPGGGVVYTAGGIYRLRIAK